MTDHDYPPLRQMVEAMLMTVDEYGSDADTLTIHFEALRAALATQPQPLFQGTLSTFLTDAPLLSPDLPIDIVVYPAVAGSATPEEET